MATEYYNNNMFNPIQIKHEYIEIEDNYGDANDTSMFIVRNVDYKYNSLPQFWGHAQFPNEIQPKTEIDGQQSLFQIEENNSSASMKNYLQNNTLVQVNQEESVHLNHLNQQSHINVAENTEKLHHCQDIQQPKFQNQMLTISDTVSLSTSNHSENPPNSCAIPNVEKKFKCQCQICFKEFRHKSNLFIHMRIHSGERPYKCNQCEKCFTHSGNLVIHMRTHSGEKPYSCQLCEKTFSHSGNLSTHLRTHSGVRPYKCNICNKEFRHSGNLSIHQRIHSGIRPFKCKVCGKDFYHSGNLTTHMKKHTVNINTNVNQSENNKKQIVYDAVNFNGTVSSNVFNNLSPNPNIDVKLMPNTNTIVSIKNENCDGLDSLIKI